MPKYEIQFTLHSNKCENVYSHIENYIKEQLDKLKEIYNNKVNIYDSSTIIFDYIKLENIINNNKTSDNIDSHIGGYTIETNINTTFVQSLFEKLHKELSKTALEHNVGYAFNVHII